jgi:hypothetical protein
LPREWCSSPAANSSRAARCCSPSSSALEDGHNAAILASHRTSRFPAERRTGRVRRAIRTPMEWRKYPSCDRWRSDMQMRRACMPSPQLP